MHSTVPSASELERLRCVVTWRKNKSGGILNLSPLVSGRGVERPGPIPVGVQFFQLLMLIGVVRKVFSVIVLIRAAS